VFDGCTCAITINVDHSRATPRSIYNDATGSVLLGKKVALQLRMLNNSK
jgi:hypothetical protein